MVALLDSPVAERLTLTQLARREGVSPATTWRWAMRGVRGVKLPTVMIGAKRTTTIGAFRQWCERVTAVANGEPLPSRTSKQRESAIRAAERELEKAGF